VCYRFKWDFWVGVDVALQRRTNEESVSKSPLVRSGVGGGSGDTQGCLCSRLYPCDFLKDFGVAAVLANWLREYGFQSF